MISNPMVVLYSSCFAAIVLLSAYANASEVTASNSIKLHVFKGVIRFNIHKNELTDEKGSKRLCTESPEFQLHQVTWKIEAWKGPISVEFDDKLMVRLVSVFKGQTEEWSCGVNVKFTLLPKDPSYNPATTRSGYFVYDSAMNKPIKKKLVKWEDLLTKYMVEDVATIDVTIEVDPPNRIPGIQHTATKFQMRVLEVDTLDYLYSDEAVIRGIRWKVLAMKRKEHLGVYVIANEDDMDLDYAWNVSATFHLMSLDAKKIVSKTFSEPKPFDWTLTNWGFSEFIKWADFMNLSNKFVINGAAFLQIELSVAKPVELKGSS